MVSNTVENSHWDLAIAYDGAVDRTEDEYGNTDACANNTSNRSDFIIFVPKRWSPWSTHYSVHSSHDSVQIWNIRFSDS